MHSQAAINTNNIIREEPVSVDELRVLSKTQIQAASAPHVFSRAALRNRGTLVDAVAISPPDVQEHVHQAAQVAQLLRSDKKRKQLSQCSRDYRACKRVKEVDAHEDGDLPNDGNDTNGDPKYEDAPGGPMDQSEHMETRNVERFLDLPTPEELKDCHRRFREATSNEALAQAVCAPYARLLIKSELTLIDYASLPHRHLLIPQQQHKAHVLMDGMLLVAEHVERRGSSITGYICSHCSSALKRNRLLAYTLANNMWIGPVPDALSILTLPKRLLIALRYPRGFVYKLSPSGGHSDPHTMQWGLKGNVTTYTSNVPAVVAMLEGQLMPHTTAILPSLIAVTFIGRQTLTKSLLKSIFRIRRQVVHAALLMLKHTTEHPGYTNLEINPDAISLLPEDDVPAEIMLTLRCKLDKTTVIRESAGYVPPETENGKWLNILN